MNKTSCSTSSYAILHATTHVHIRPPNHNKYFPLQLAYDHDSNISYFIIFEFEIYVHIASLQYTKIDPRRRLRIYVRFDSPSIIKYLETKDLSMTQFLILF